MAKLIDMEVEGISELVKAMRAMPERLDKDMRKEFRKIAKDVEGVARNRAKAAHPVAKTPRHAGEYHWTQLVNSIKAGAEGDAPTVSYGSTKVPGWAGWEFGGTKTTRFGPRTAKSGRGNVGNFFFPAVKDKTPDVFKAANEVVNRYAAEAFDN